MRAVVTISQYILSLFKFVLFPLLSSHFSAVVLPCLSGGLSGVIVQTKQLFRRKMICASVA